MARLLALITSAISSVGPGLLWPGRLIEACAERHTPQAEGTDRTDPARLKRVLSLLGPFFEPGLLCVVGAGRGRLCEAGLLREGFRRIVVTEEDPERFGVLNARLLLEPLGDRVTALCARCGAPPCDETDSTSHVLRTDGPMQRGLSMPRRSRSPSQDITVDQLVPCARPGSALVWISARALQPDLLAGARAVVERGVPLMVRLPRTGTVDPAVYGALRSTLNGAPYTHCYRIGRSACAQALDRRELDLLLDHPGPRDGATDLLFF